jgi:hypothetical protein
MIKTLQLVAVLCVAIAMSAGWAHLLALPNKMSLSREQYLTVQQIYRGWALLGIPIFAALLLTAVLAVLQRREGAAFYFDLAAGLCITLSLIIFFSFTFPANQETRNWTVLAESGWEVLRRRWEYSHAAGAILYFIALTCLVLSIMSPRRRG